MNRSYSFFFAELFLLPMLFIGTVNAASNFNQIYGISAIGYEELAQQVVQARFDDTNNNNEQQYLHLKTIQKRLEKLEERLKNDPLVWFLSGLNSNNLAETRFLMLLDTSSREVANQDSELLQHNINRARNYEKAIYLDEKEPHKLSSTIYATMSYGLSNRQKIKTYSREIKLGTPAENESNEIFMHWAKIDVLVHEKRIKEAAIALQELQDLLDKKNKTQSSYASIVDKAKDQVKKANPAIDSRKKKQAETNKRRSAEVAQQASLSWLFFAIGGVILVFVVVSAILFRKHAKASK